MTLNKPGKFLDVGAGEGFALQYFFDFGWKVTGLTKLASNSGWCANNFLTDFPIDLDLFSKNSNYIENPDLGRKSHLKRVEIENLLHSISPQKTNVLNQALSELDIGRNITGFLLKQTNNDFFLINI